MLSKSSNLVWVQLSCKQCGELIFYRITLVLQSFWEDHGRTCPLWDMQGWRKVKKMKCSTAKCFDFSGAGDAQQLCRYIHELWKAHFPFWHVPWKEDPSSARGSSPMHFYTILWWSYLLQMKTNKSGLCSWGLKLRSRKHQHREWCGGGLMIRT